jgi:hypothetical protein
MSSAGAVRGTLSWSGTSTAWCCTRGPKDLRWGPRSLCAQSQQRHVSYHWHAQRVRPVATARLWRWRRRRGGGGNCDCAVTYTCVNNMGWDEVCDNQRCPSTRSRAARPSSSQMPAVLQAVSTPPGEAGAMGVLDQGPGVEHEQRGPVPAGRVPHERPRGVGRGSAAGLPPRQLALQHGAGRRLQSLEAGAMAPLLRLQAQCVQCVQHPGQWSASNMVGEHPCLHQ